MKVKHDYYQNLSYESRAKFDERVYKSNTGQLLGEQVVTNEFSVSSVLGNSSGENAQRFYGLEAQTEMEKLFTEPKQSKELTLRRKARGAFSKSQNWKRLVRDVADNAGFPPPLIEKWCQKCREDTKFSKRSPYATSGDQYFVHRFPRWTKGKPAKYIEPKPRCLNCTSGSVWPWIRLIPVNPSILSIDMDELRTWAQKHVYMDTNYLITALAARKPMPRQRVVQAKPRQRRRRSKRPRSANLQSETQREMQGWMALPYHGDT